MIFDVKSNDESIIKSYQSQLINPRVNIQSIIGEWDYNSILSVINLKLDNTLLLPKNISKSPKKEMVNKLLFEGNDFNCMMKSYSQLNLNKRKFKSSTNLTRKFTVFNYISYLKNEEEKLNEVERHDNKIDKLLKSAKFSLFSSDIFPEIYNINLMMKKLFTLMKFITHQFDDIRKVISKYTNDEVNSSSYSITEAFTSFYEITTELNRINNQNLTNKLKMFLDYYTLYIKSLESRIKQSEIKLIK